MTDRISFLDSIATLQSDSKVIIKTRLPPNVPLDFVRGKFGKVTDLFK